MPMLLAYTLAAITISSRFEGGSTGPVEQTAPHHFRVAVAGEADQDKRNRQASWYYFQIDGAKGRALTIELTNLVGEYNYKSGTHAVTKNTRPVWSEDNRTWRHFETVEWDDAKKELRLRLTPRTNRLWIAHAPPYTTVHLQALLGHVRQHKGVRVESIGQTVGGREIPLISINEGATPKPVIWLMARQHSWETGTSWMTDAGLRWLLSSDAQAKRLREGVIWKIFPMADPDGCARGGVRYNANGYDLNRNWDKIDAQRMPEIAAQRKAMLAWLDSGRQINLFLTLHNQENHDHVEGPMTLGGVTFGLLGHALYNGLKQQTSFWSKLDGPRDMAASTTPGQQGRMNVVQGLFAERKVPAFLLETSVEAVETLHRPRTVEDWRAFGRGLFRVLYDSAMIE